MYLLQRTEIHLADPPAPSVVLAVGEFAARAVWQAQNIYLRGQKQRALSTGCYTLRLAEDGLISLAPLAAPLGPSHTTGGAQPERSSALQERRTSLRSAMRSIHGLQASLAGIVHELRAHERLLEVGWRDTTNVPLDLYLLADLADPWSAGSLLPLAALLNEIASMAGLCRAHLLLSTAVFPQPPTLPQDDLSVNVLTCLQALDEFLRPASEKRTQVMQSLGFQNTPPPDFAVYLFDCHKEGTTVVRDKAGMNALLGNALLTLLQGGLARRLHAERDDFVLQTGAGFYSAIGAAALVYDPASLQQAAARRLALEFMESKILGPAREEIVEAAFQQAQTALGGMEQWQEELLTRVTMRQPSPLLAELDFECFRETRWAHQIQETALHFDGNVFPELSARLNKTVDEMAARLDGVIGSLADAWPLEARLYPGGVQNAVQIAERLRAWLQNEDVRLAEQRTRAQEQAGALESRLAAVCRQLQEAIDAVPHLPGILRLAPNTWRPRLAALFYLYYHGRRIHAIQVLRDETLELLRLTLTARQQCAALELLCSLPSRWVNMLAQASEDYVFFAQLFAETQQGLSPTWDEFPLGVAINGWENTYRRSMIDREQAEWAYRRWFPDLNAWLPVFLSGLNANLAVGTPAGRAKAPAGWRSSTPETLCACLLEQASRVYQPLWELNLEQFLRQEAGLEMNPGQNQVSLEKNMPAAQIVAACMQAAVPPLRADFDAVGEGGHAQIAFYVMPGWPGWQWAVPAAPVFGNGGKDNWQTIFTGDPYTALCLQVRRGVPLKALVEIVQPARRRLEQITGPMRRAFDLFADPDEAETPWETDADGEATELVRKQFRWQFRPRGSGKDVEQWVEVEIDRRRFEHYRRLPRFSGEWNRYAEAEMPEVRSLAAGFQRLHNTHRWSTFNQASNVLKFVQTNIPYLSDSDTTGHNDWARYPIETLMEQTGDCEDVVILCAALLARLGFQVVLMLFTRGDETNAAHLAFGVAGAEGLKGEYIFDPASQQRYFYGEATASGWHLGEIPKHYRGVNPDQLLPVKILIADEG